MKTKKILFYLKDIEAIAKFQQKRIAEKDKANKNIILREALLFIERDIKTIGDLI